jgi:hypothetical protein
LEESQCDSIFRSLVKDDSRQTAIMRKALWDHPKAWQKGGLGIG